MFETDAPEQPDETAFEGGPRIFRDAPGSLAFRKLRKRIVRQTREAIEAYSMLPPAARTTEGRDKPARWLVCLSGGKDSYTLLAALLDLQWQGALPVELLACNLDQGQPGFPKETLPDYLASIDVPHRIITEETYSVVTDKIPEHKTYCSLCSRLRRGILYRVAREEGCEAVVLGHHRDDLLETFFMSLMHGGRLATMPPKLLNDEGDLLVLRPLSFVAEEDCAKFARLMEFPIIPCTLCGSQDGLQRMMTKQMLDEWEKKRPGVRQTMFRALTEARPSHLADPKLFDFAALRPGE